MTFEGWKRIKMNEWLRVYAYSRACLLYTCVCKIFQAPELQNINCMREQQVTFILMPLLWKWKRTQKYHTQNYVKKTTEEKIDSALLFVSIAPATKIHAYYLILKPSSRNKSKKDKFSVSVRASSGIQMWCRLNWDNTLSLSSLPLLQSQSGHTTLKCDEYLLWGARNSRFDCQNENVLRLWFQCWIGIFTQFSPTESKDWRLPFIIFEIRFQITEPVSTVGTTTHQHLTGSAQESIKSITLSAMDVTEADARNPADKDWAEVISVPNR